jgi:hypothetical protein
MSTSQQLPKLETLHRAFVDLVLQYQQRFEIALPPINSNIILYRHIKRLAIPSMNPIHHSTTENLKLIYAQLMFMRLSGS